MKKLSLGIRDEQIKTLKDELIAEGYGQFLSSENKTDKDYDLFNDNLRKSLTLFQKENNYEEAVPYTPKVGDSVFVVAGPTYEVSPDSIQAKRRKRNIENDFYKVKRIEGKYYIILVDGKECKIEEGRVYKRKVFCDVKTWEKLKQKVRDNPNRTDVYDNLKSGTTATSIVATIGSTFAEGINIVDNITSKTQAVVRDIVSGVGAITSIATNLFRDAPDFEMKGKIVSIANITDPNNSIILYLPIIPDSVNVNHSVKWNSETPMGRTAGYHGYYNTSDRSVSFSVDLYIRDFEDVETYQKAINFLLALTYPLYDSGKIIPPRCYVSIFGQLKFCGYCTSNNPSYKGNIVDGVYSHTSFSLNFTATSDVPFSTSDVFNDGELNSTMVIHSTNDNNIYPIVEGDSQFLKDLSSGTTGDIVL